MKIQVAAIITAAGSSSRMDNVKKEFLPMPTAAGEKPLTVLGAAVNAFMACTNVDLVIIVIPKGMEKEARDALPDEFNSGQTEKKILFAEGGPNRQASVYNALRALEQSNPMWVLIHDGARPWIKPELIDEIIHTVIMYKAVVPVLPVVETPKEIEYSGTGGMGFVTRHLKRSCTGTAQTPQAFVFPGILDAHKKAAENCAENPGVEYTDDAEIWGEFAGKVAVIQGDPENKKITFQKDLSEKPDNK